MFSNAIEVFELLVFNANLHVLRRMVGWVVVWKATKWHASLHSGLVLYPNPVMNGKTQSCEDAFSLWKWCWLELYASSHCRVFQLPSTPTVPPRRFGIFCSAFFMCWHLLRIQVQRCVKYLLISFFYRCVFRLMSWFLHWKWCFSF